MATVGVKGLTVNHLQLLCDCDGTESDNINVNVNVLRTGWTMTGTAAAGAALSRRGQLWVYGQRGLRQLASNLQFG